VDKELNRLGTLAKKLSSSLPFTDPRLSDVLVFFIGCAAPHETVIKRALLEKISFLKTLDNEPKYVFVFLSDLFVF
jgi:hypothetical protein